VREQLRTAALGAGLGAVGVLLIAALGPDVSFEPRKLIATIDGADIALFAVWALLAVLLHELGHLAGGLYGGMRFLMFAAGPVRVVRTPAGLQLARHPLRSGLLGFVFMVPDPARPFAPQFRMLVAGGPAVSLLCAVAGAGVAVTSHGTAALHAGVFASLSALVLAATAIPMRVGGFDTDGEQLRDLVRGGTRTELKSLLLALLGQSASGVRPRDLEQTLLSRAIELADAHAEADPAYGAFVHLIAAVRADDGGNMTARDRHFAAVAANARGLPAAVRAQLALELAYDAARGNRVDVAREWLRQSRGGIVEPADRARTEAAMALAEGRIDDARTAIALARAGLVRACDVGFAQWARDELDRMALRAPPA
jgi:hypothetical protein